MFRLNRFTYLSPRSLEDALDLLASNADEAMLMAGGTDLLVNIKHRVATPGVVIGLRSLPELNGIEGDSRGWLNIGAAVTLRRIETEPFLSDVYPALAYAAGLVSVPQIRAVGTIGGNVCLDVRCNYYNQSFEWRKGIGFCMKRDSPICRVAPGGDRCWAVSSADTVPVLIALRSDVSVVGSNGTRRLPLDHLYQDDGLAPMTLQPGEIVTSIHVPPPEGYATVYQKFRIRHSFDFPLAGVAVSVRRSGDIVEDARIVLTAVASYPERAVEAEESLRAKALDDFSIADAGAAVFRRAKPMDNTAGTIFHRKRMARVLVERALREIAGLSEPIRNTA